MAYFHQSGIDDFKDAKGNSIPQVNTPPDHMPLATITDALQHGPHQIAIQFLGFQL